MYSFLSDDELAQEILVAYRPAYPMSCVGEQWLERKRCTHSRPFESGLRYHHRTSGSTHAVDSGDFN
jgi:hypothetical protein